MSKRLENKVAIVTGGASGLGKAIVERFNEEGAKVVVADINEQNGNEIVKTLNDGLFIKV